jgi:hypothetical protein
MFCHKIREKVIGTGKGKSKAIPLQAWTDPKSSRRFRIPYFISVET